MAALSLKNQRDKLDQRPQRCKTRAHVFPLVIERNPSTADLELNDMLEIRVTGLSTVLCIRETIQTGRNNRCERE